MSRLIEQKRLISFNVCDDIAENLLSDQSVSEKMRSYDQEQYISDVTEYGLENTWSVICSYFLSPGASENDFLKVSDFSDIYEMGLAVRDKAEKKKSGQYATPGDVASVMAQWMEVDENDNICDVACGTGNLIGSYLSEIGTDKAKKILAEGRVFLYENDKTALDICKIMLAYRYGAEYVQKVNVVCGDFLDRKISLPKNSVVISNPPYAHIETIPSCWEKTDVVLQTKEKYAAFMEKIIDQSKRSVIITPYSFLGGNKFYSLRKKMNERTGFVISFDNVPGNIFHGKKHGIFNSNTSNSVRAAITVIRNKDQRGFQISPLIRFKTQERSALLSSKILESFVPQRYQKVDKDETMYYKCDKRLLSVFDCWVRKSDKVLGDYVSKAGEYRLYVPNTCRYFTVATNHLLRRTGQVEICVENEDVFNYVFCMLNSSLAYWHWRLYDGGITYQKNLMHSLPVFYDLLSDEDKKFFHDIAVEMIQTEKQYIVHKNNVGIQENVKYPRRYRDLINERVLQILGIRESVSVFDYVHSSMALEVCV